MSRSLCGRIMAMGAMVGLIVSSMATDASARTARQYYAHGRGYGYPHHYRQYGNGIGGAAVAGAALGVLGLAAGAAAASRYDGGYGNYGYGNDGYDQGYGYAPYGYYAPY